MNEGVVDGVTKSVSVTGASAGAGAFTINLRPDKGCVWEVLLAYGYQDDGAVSQSWLMTDVDNGNVNLFTITGAANVHWHFGTEDDTAGSTQLARGPLILTYDRYLRFQFTASAGAKNSYIKALVREWRGLNVEA